ncbi:MAG: SLC13 family permease [Halothiobacillaceae bacterium]
MIESALAQQVVALGTIAVLVGLLVQGRFRPGLLFAAALAWCYLLGLIRLEPMLHNFVNPALVTLVMLVLYSVVLERTRLVQATVDGLLRGGYRASLARLMFSVGLMSAFLNNTAVVAALMGRIRAQTRFAPSRLLIPLSFAAILGGTLTLVGTSTHLILNGFVIDAGLPALGMFDFLPVGILLLLAGIAYMVLVGPWLLPSHREKPSAAPQFFVEARIEPGSPLAGRSVQENGLRQLHTLFLAELIRDGKLSSPVSPQEVLAPGDVLVFSGRLEDADVLAGFKGLRVIDGDHDQLLRANLVEVIIAAGSTLIGRRIRDANFRAQFDAAVVGVRRGNQQLSGGLGQIRLQAGDNLMLATGPDFVGRENLDRNFHVLSDLGQRRQLAGRASAAAFGAFGTVIAAAALGVVSLFDGLLALLALALVARWVSVAELRRRFPHELVIIIGSALGLAQVLLSTGAAELLAEGIDRLFAGWGVFGALVSVYLLTWLLTEVITNNAAAALVFPVAYALAQAYQVDPMPFILTVAYAASASFMSPYGYQTNLMVRAAGRYEFSTFLRIGTPLAFIVGLIVLFFVPVFHPFAP